MADVSEGVIQQVFEALEQEADLDGYATTTGTRIGELIGTTSMTANRALQELERRHRIKRLTSGKGSTTRWIDGERRAHYGEYQILEEST